MANYTHQQRESAAFVRAFREGDRLSAEELQEHEDVLRDLGVRRHSQRCAIIDEALNRGLNVMEFRDQPDSRAWFHDQPVEWWLGDLKVRPSTIWAFHTVASIVNIETVEWLNNNGFIMPIEDNVLFRFINRRKVRRFEKQFAALLHMAERHQLAAAITASRS